MLNPRIELAVTSVFIIAILLGLFLTSRIDLAFSSDLETFSGPRAYPGLILGLLLALNGALAIGQIRAIGKTRTPPADGPFDRRTLWAAALFLTLLVFVAAFEPVGYILTMVPLLTGVALLCGAGKPVRAAVVALCLAAACLVIFRYGLATVLPEGIFGIDALV